MTMPARTYSMVYGSLTFGGASTTYFIDGPVKIEKSYQMVRYRFSVVVVGSSAAAFSTAAAALEAELRAPHKDLVVTLGSSPVTYSLSTHTALSLEPAASCSGSPADCDRARSYDCAVEVALPADRPGDGGLQESQINVSQAPNGVRVVTIGGEYTALGSNTSRAQYLASIDAYTTSVKAIVDPSSTVIWEQTDPLAGEIDKLNGNCKFTRIIKEVIYQKSVGASADVAAIKEPRITANPVIIFDGTAVIGSRRPVALDVTYEAVIDKAQSVDLVGLYASTIRPLMLAYAAVAAGAASVSGDPIVQAEAPAFAPTQNTVQASIRLLYTDGGLFAAELEDEVEIGPAFALRRVYSPRQYARKAMPTSATAVRTVSAAVTILGDRTEALSRALQLVDVFVSGQPVQLAPTLAPHQDRYGSIALDELPEPGLSDSGRWVKLGFRPKFVGPVYVGESRQPVTTCVAVVVFEWAEEDQGGASLFGSDGGGRFSTVERGAP